ncbi:UNVERIFIED_ORG: hypothetical protein GGD44_000120 [Rhizobium esperanzae]|nr:hypothetical protein RHECNPAF_87009 [Rhizobium etli CNPAF512]
MGISLSTLGDAMTLSLEDTVADAAIQERLFTFASHAERFLSQRCAGIVFERTISNSILARD